MGTFIDQDNYYRNKTFRRNKALQQTFRKRICTAQNTENSPIDCRINKKLKIRTLKN